MKPEKPIVDIINNHHKFLIATHIDPDGDALGSQIALAMLLEKRGKVVGVVSDQSVPDKYSFLPGIEKLKSESKEDFEVAIFIDSAEMSRADKAVANIDFSNKTVINIDHHISNTNFGDVNWVEPDTSSCGEMIYRLFKELNVPLDREIALNLYTAIFTDTGSFRYSNTKTQTLKVVVELLKYGINPEEIYEKVYEINSVAEVKLLGFALSQLCLSEDNRICWLKITGEMLKQFKAKLKNTDDFTNFARSIAGVEVTILFTELEGGEIKVSFRSKGRVDVNRIAQLFGGGGHRAASGCRIKGTMQEVEKKVIAKAKEWMEF